jgi:HD superfamily phosphohydrolase
LKCLLRFWRLFFGSTHVVESAGATTDSAQMPKSERIRDPVHDLIEFGSGDFEQMAWSLLETPEFQRLRRIKQLGFSELVFPGATHSRFAHSIGVFHTARQLSHHIQTCLGGKHTPARAEAAMAAALVHDLGHGPFSHAFESGSKKFTSKARHEEWTAEIISGDTNVGKILEQYRAGFREEVAELIAADTPEDIYGSIVSSQFDADRLDYIRRDRMMCGVYHGGFDFSWLMANLEVDRIPLARDDETIGEVDALILSRKALQAAESYVLGLFHLYFTVYFHKTTRGAEMIFKALLLRIGELVKAGEQKTIGLAEDHPILEFINENTLSNYLRLDDFVIWQGLQAMTRAKDEFIRELSNRLLNRVLYKAIDVTARLFPSGGEGGVAHFKSRLADAKKAGSFGPIDVFEDNPRRNPYKRRGFETPEALSKVLIRRADGTGYEDVRDCSNVVKAMEETTMFRVYVRDPATNAKLEALIEGA